MNRWDWEPLVTAQEAIKLRTVLNYVATVDICFQCWRYFCGHDGEHLTDNNNFDGLAACFAAGYLQGRREMKAERRKKQGRYKRHEKYIKI